MKSLTIATLLAATAGLAAAFPLVSAQVHGHNNPFHKMHAGHDDLGAHFEHLAAKLELTVQQRMELAEILAKSEIFTRAKAMIAAHDAQLAKVHQKHFSEEQVRAASKALAPAHEELAVAVAQIMREAHKVLDAKQLTRLTELHDHLHPGLGNHVEAMEKAMGSWVERNRK